MSEKDSLDLGRIVGLIMENPQIIEQISALAKKNGEPEQTATPPEPEATPKLAKVNSAIESEEIPAPAGKYERAKLLTALKPYVSSERAKAIDSMISLADIIDMMKLR